MRWMTAMAAAGMLLAGLVVGSAGGGSTALPPGNLVKNPGGEVPFGGDFWTRGIEPAVWVQATDDDERGKGVQVVLYGKDPRLLDKKLSAAIGGGRNFFSGGYPSRVATAYQMIAVGGAASDIDGGGVKSCLSAYLGGQERSAVTARVDLQFLSEDGSVLGQLRIGPVTRGQRLDAGTLLFRASEQKVPANTRQLKVSFTAESDGGPNNVGYADNISVALTKGSCLPVLAVKCVKKALVASVTPSAVAATQRVRFAVKGGKKTKVATGKSTSRFTMDGLTGKLTVTANVAQKGGGTIVVTKKSRRC
jgi:multidrug efflux pump subunit AcrA (membrane-fusion protein)